jgi:hypothetical protein
MRSQKTLCRKPFREDNDGPQEDFARVIKAEEFQLVDKEGRMRAVLALEDDQPGLFLFDKEESLRASFCLDEGGEPCLDMLDKGDVTRVVLWVNGGESNLTLCDKEGVFRLQIYASDDDEGHGMALLDRAGRPCAFLEVGEDDEGSLEFFDEKERRRYSVTLVEDDDVKPNGSH